MDSLHTLNGIPIGADVAVAGPAPAPPTPAAAAVTQGHKPESGQVGLTGVHGEIGSNAK